MTQPANVALLCGHIVRFNSYPSFLWSNKLNECNWSDLTDVFSNMNRSLGRGGRGTSYISSLFYLNLNREKNSAPFTTLRNPEMNQKWNCSKLGNAWQWLSWLKWAYTAHLVICTPTCSSEQHNYRVSRGPSVPRLHPSCFLLPLPCSATEVLAWNGC